MEESQYIFAQTENLYYTGLIVLSIFGLIGLCQIFLFLYEKYYDSSDKPNFNRRVLGIGFCILFIAGLIILRNQTNRERRIKANYAETKGMTLRKVHAKGYYIDYEFTINKILYKNTSGITYNGSDIDDIIVPNGYYKVIFNKLNPNESIMDFKAKR